MPILGSAKIEKGHLFKGKVQFWLLSDYQVNELLSKSLLCIINPAKLFCLTRFHLYKKNYMYVELTTFAGRNFL